MMLQRSVTADGYKLVVYPEVPKVLLFDLKNDPDEMHDLSVRRTSGNACRGCSAS